MKFKFADDKDYEFEIRKYKNELLLFYVAIDPKTMIRNYGGATIYNKQILWGFGNEEFHTSYVLWVEKLLSNGFKSFCERVIKNIAFI